jgi:hypothetical protein
MKRGGGIETRWRKLAWQCRRGGSRSKRQYQAYNGILSRVLLAAAGGKTGARNSSNLYRRRYVQLDGGRKAWRALISATRSRRLSKTAAAWRILAATRRRCGEKPRENQLAKTALEQAAEELNSLAQSESGRWRRRSWPWTASAQASAYRRAIGIGRRRNVAEESVAAILYNAASLAISVICNHKRRKMAWRRRAAYVITASDSTGGGVSSGVVSLAAAASRGVANVGAANMAYDNRWRQHGGNVGCVWPAGGCRASSSRISAAAKAAAPPSAISGRRQAAASSVA